MCDVTRDLHTPPFLQTATFSQTPPSPGAWNIQAYFIRGRKTFITLHSVIQRRFDVIIPRMRAALVQSKSFAHVGSSDLTLTAPGNTISVTYPAALSCLLTQAMMPLENIANLNDAI